LKQEKKFIKIEKSSKIKLKNVQKKSQKIQTKNFRLKSKMIKTLIVHRQKKFQEKNQYKKVLERLRSPKLGLGKFSERKNYKIQNIKIWPKSWAPMV